MFVYRSKNYLNNKYNMFLLLKYLFKIEMTSPIEDIIITWVKSYLDFERDSENVIAVVLENYSSVDDFISHRTYITSVLVRGLSEEDRTVFAESFDVIGLKKRSPEQENVMIGRNRILQKLRKMFIRLGQIAYTNLVFDRAFNPPKKFVKIDPDVSTTEALKPPLYRTKSVSIIIIPPQKCIRKKAPF
jgi:hypothetical protein